MTDSIISPGKKTWKNLIYTKFGVSSHLAMYGQPCKQGCRKQNDDAAGAFMKDTFIILSLVKIVSTKRLKRNRRVFRGWVK